MTKLTPQKIKAYTKVYWQPAVLGILAAILFTQLFGWASTYSEMRKVDQLIQAAENTNPDNKENTNNPGRPPQPQNNQDRKPEKNIFKREQMQYQLTAIFFEKAIVNGQEVKVGDKIQGKAEVKEINIDHIVVQEEGKDNTQKVEMFKGGVPSRPSRPPSRGSRRGPSRPRPSGPPQRTVTSQQAQPPSGGIPAGIREKMMSMSPEERRNFFRNMTPQQQQELRERFRR